MRERECSNRQESPSRMVTVTDYAAPGRVRLVTRALTSRACVRGLLKAFLCVCFCMRIRHCPMRPLRASHLSIHLPIEHTNSAVGGPAA